MAIGGLLLASCSIDKTGSSYSNELNFAAEQTAKLGAYSIENKRLPRTLDIHGEMHWAHETGFDWTEGFFPGTCWYLYDFTNDDKFKIYAEQLQESFKEHRFRTTNHDLGFVFNCSYGQDYRLTGNRESQQVLIDAGNSLIERFNPAVGCIQSWDVDKGWQAERGWQFPVIIDNMMNLELLFEVSKITGDDKYKNIALTHANTTLENHFRPDNSSFHVIDYDSISGAVRNKHTAQGFANESAWARGQAWGLYGFTLCYRYSKDEKYLMMAEKIADFIIHHKRLPDDMVPVWDFDAPDTDADLRDASAAAIIASALIELDSYSATDYLTVAKEIIKNLSSDKYKTKLDEDYNFLLKHCVGSIPHNNEIDVPLVYADYYYTEALLRLNHLSENEK